MEFAKKNWKLLTLVGVLFLSYLWINPIGTYNRMVTNEENTQESWGNVETAYQERSDLIPNLLEIVKGSASHEKETLKEIVEARSNITEMNIDTENMSAEDIELFMSNQDQLTSSLSKLLLVVEDYPDLKANQNFLDLQTQLEGMENRIRVERNKYNGFAKTENTYIKKFPNNVLNNMFDFEEKPYFQSESGSEQAPEISFD